MKICSQDKESEYNLPSLLMHVRFEITMHADLQGQDKGHGYLKATKINKELGLNKSHCALFIFREEERPRSFLRVPLHIQLRESLRPISPMTEPSPTPELKTYKGNCHCGAFKFNMKVPELTSFTECNCDICFKRGYKWVFPSARCFTIEKGIKA
jgi:hypothetical protein